MMHAKKELTEPARPASRSFNFLLVDDDDVCLFIHRRVLEMSGYCSSSRPARNGKFALEILNDAAAGFIPVPDIILLDLQMPQMNGIAFLEAFQRLDYPKKSSIAIVLLTSSVSETEKEYAMSLGASKYLTKPLTLEALNAVVHSLYGNESPLPVMTPCG
jgi:CheY-like chemotaxis protein